MRVAIIGAGAAGLMCAATINEQDSEVEVILIEKNNILGKKVLISGGGRCNVTTGLQDVKVVLTKYPRGNKFLNSAMHLFSPLDVSEWFVSHGVPLKCEKDDRVFPVSNQGEDIVGVFEKIFEENKTKILFGHHVLSIEKLAKSFTIHIKNSPSLKVDKVVLAMGGQAYRQTGSTGDGYALAESLGHHITSLAPSLSSLLTREKWPSEVAGLSFAKANFKVRSQKNIQFSGPFVFTHWGLSGPAIFALSSLLAFENFDEKKPLELFVDLLPDLSFEQINNKLKVFIDANPKKSAKYVFHDIIPLSLGAQALKEMGIKSDKKNNEISKQELRLLCEWLKNLPLTIIGRRAGDEFVTAGGVDLKEVDSSTMASKICQGLFFGGEILDIDGFTGGFNLQAAWATGRLAGLSCTKQR